MNIIAVDDEQAALNILEKAIRQAVPDCSLACFTTATSALEHAKTARPDVAFLDIDMSRMNGLTLAKHLKDIYGKTNIVFVTGHSQYTGSAIALRASGYIMKPATAERVKEELEELRHPLELSEEGVRIRCFGSFSVFVDGQLLVFPNAKAKELLALLVHKYGDDVSNAEIAAVLWEDKPYGSSLQSQTRRVRGQLSKVLKGAGIDDIVVKGFNSIAVDVKKVACDYHEFLKGNTAALNTYTGEYMSEYSWAEFTAAYLERRK
ncbi:response regulator [Ruminococcaceae bacterium OttesenSCG-928-L11]|nr:response regulator [Ruminococcaceae bacterium OttesenSCG-928-L11]